MTQTIKIKRSTGSAAPSSLARGELAYSSGDNKLYIGDPSSSDDTATPLHINKGAIEALDSTVTDVFEIDSDNELAAKDAGTGDHMILWDDSEGKLIYTKGTGSFIPDNTIGTDELDVTGVGDVTKFLRSDGDGSFTWAVPQDDNVSVANLRNRLPQISDNVTIGDATDVTITTSGSLVVTGDLTVSGSTTTINTTELTIADNYVHLNSDLGDSVDPTETAGFQVNRGSQTDATLFWDETDNIWRAGIVTQNDADPILARDYTDGGGSHVITGNEDHFLMLDNGVPKKVAPSQVRVDDLVITNRIAESHLQNNSVSTDKIANGAVNNAKLGDGAVTTGKIKGSALLTSGETFADVDTQLMTAAAINDRIESFGYLTNVTEGAGIDVSSNGSTRTISVDLSELTDMTAAITKTQDELILLDNSQQRRKLISEIPLSAFNNDSGFTTNDGDITSIAITSGDGSISGVGTTSSGPASFDLEVATIDGGTY